MAEITLALTALNRGASDDATGIYPLSSLPTEEALVYNKYIAKFADLSSTYQYRALISCKVNFYAYPRTSSSSIATLTALSCKECSSAWDPTTANYNNININTYQTSSLTDTDIFSGSSWSSVSATFTKTAKIKSILEYGVMFAVGYSYIASASYSAKFVTKGSNAPYLTLTLSDSNVYLKISSASPTSGYQAKSKACTFNWSVSASSASITTPTVASSKFRWRADSSSTATEVDCGTALTYTLPASSVSTDSFQWQCEVTDNNGNVSTSDWYTISTLEALSTASIVSPKNDALDGSVANEFSWLHEISTGTAQTKADLQYSSDSGSTWSTLATVTGSASTKTISAGTFNSGTYLWRVRTYNTDNNAGSWSDSASFTVISAPPTPTVTCEQNPKPLVSWQSSDQQGYRVYIDDVYDSGIVFGTATSYTLKKYLDDGTYTVKVKIQNSYGLWSEAGTAPLTVSNTAGASMTLVASGTTSVVLSWTERLNYAYYLVYRDDVCIAKVRTNSYTDRTVNGTHEYFIRGIYASSKNYGLSNKASITLSLSSNVISDIDNALDLELKNTTSSYSEISVEESYVYTEVRTTASKYPMIEMSKNKSKAISFEVAYTHGNTDIQIFESMFGNTVSVKTVKGSVVTGVLLALSRKENPFYIYYSCSLSQSAYEEEVSI